MSNQQLTFVVISVLAAHVLALIAALMRRGPRAAFGLNLAVAAGVLMFLGSNRHWLQAPLDLQMAGLAAFEILALTLAALALARSYRGAIAGSWLVFSLHMLASALAVVFVLTFKITRLM